MPIRMFSRAARLAFKEFGEDRIPSAAASATFFVLLALFPALSAIVSLYGLFATPADVGGLLIGLHGVAPVSILKLVGDELARLAGLRNGGLGFAFALSLIVSIWSANSGVKALIAALEIAYETKEGRGIVRLNLVSLAFTTGAIVLAVLGGALSVSASDTSAPGGLDPDVWRWPLLLVVVVGLVWALYRFGPARPAGQRRVLMPGACLATAGTALMSGLFSWYVGNFAHYDKTYGSLGAAVGFLTWIWLTMIVVLFGAEFNSAFEKLAERKVP